MPDKEIRSSAERNCALLRVRGCTIRIDVITLVKPAATLEEGGMWTGKFYHLAASNIFDKIDHLGIWVLHFAKHKHQGILEIVNLVFQHRLR